MSTATTRPTLWPEIRIMLLAAMTVFVYTIVIGILNGTDVVDFDRRRILGHVHGGTLGWLTMSVFAASFWLFGEGAPLSERQRQVVRVLVVGAIISMPLYVIAFSTTYGNWRPIAGILATAVIAAFAIWVLLRARVIELSVPHIGFLVALGTSIVGGVLGVLLGLEIATGDNWIADGADAAHPATMVVGFLTPVGLGMAEWAFFFPRPPKATRLGVIQMLFPFAGSLILGTALLFDITPLAPIAVLLQIIGFIIFLKRMWPSIRAVDLMAATPGRHAIAAIIGLAFVIGLAQFLIIKHEGDLDLAPVHHILALDHSQFIGLMTNAIFAMLMAATIGQRGNKLDQLVFVMVNVGIIGFVIGLLADADPFKHAFTPILGVGLLIGLAMYALRLTGNKAAWLR